MKHLRFVTYFAHGNCRRSQTRRFDSPRGRGAELSVVAIQQPQFRDERGFDLPIVKHANHPALRDNDRDRTYALADRSGGEVPASESKRQIDLFD